MKELNKYFIKTAFSIARKHKATAVFLHIDPLSDLIFEEEWPWKFDLFFVSKRKKMDVEPSNKKSLASRYKDVVLIPKIPLTRPYLLKLTTLLALSSGKIRQGDKIVCIMGTPEGDLDYIQYLDTGTETEILSGKLSTNIAEGIKPEVFQAVLNIGIELSNKGREGKPVGTILTIGDEENVLQLSKQMIINPFKGYADEEKNILSPHMRDTIREFSAMDGAIIISGKGIVLSAGRYLTAVADATKLQQGLGSRHLAAAGITALTKSIALVISESSGDLRIFKDGKLLMEFEKATVKMTRS